ncbi:MAG TPA: bifunctional YncE family protein/alkaline phosphatase family protein [Terracidiphilus sp.]|jgi:YVTN family beta-propeller protein|nr:bifunctional YncE family protein/alkaline phosphatase family protein [Terracidiphilus sp.]
MKRTWLLILLGGCTVFSNGPAARSQANVTAVLPNGREIHPAGNWISLAPYPFALAVRPDGEEIAIPSIGFPFALNVVDHPESLDPQVRRMPSGENDDPAIETHAGLTYSPDGALLYVATGDSGKIRAYRTTDWSAAGEVSLDGQLGGKKFEGSFAATLTLSEDGRTIYALDQGNWRIVIIDAETMQRIASIGTGNYPIGLALSPDGVRLYVTNTGLFEYQTIPGADAKNPLGTGLHFPPFAYPSKAAREGTVAEGKKIPGLGGENSDRGSSLWTYDLRDREHPAVTAKLRLGDKITEARGETVGGAAPTGVAATADAVFVSLAHEDAIAKVSADGVRLLAEAKLSPFSGRQFEDASGEALRGVMPSGLAARDGRVYVAEAGIDAVGVVDAESLQVIGHIPVGWNPSAVGFSPDGKMLYVVNTKGKGAGPNAGKGHDPKMPTYVGSLEYGGLSAIPVGMLPSAAKLTQTVIASNTAAVAGRSTLPRLKHCFLVIRENRTYDEVLGDVTGANGDASLARYGVDGWAAEAKAARHLKVTPNLHALVARYAMSDNFYVDSDVSADGHRWVMGINPTPYFNTAWTSGYGGRRHEFAGAEQPGRRALFGGADAPMPEDEPQFGSLWEHIVASGKGVLNYGEGLEVEGNDELPGSQPEGQRLFLNSPLLKPIYESTDRHYPTFNLGIPDQFRVDEFERDFKLKLAAGKVPALIVIRLPNDHTAEARPLDGYPYRASYVADNDLALGRIVAFLSKTGIWKDSALFVTEDDAQNGVDHVDAHRSILMIASPWVKPGSVSHEHTSMGSITQTIDELLGLGYLNLEDALAGQITGIFDTAPHMESFSPLGADPRVFVAAKAKFAKPKTKEEAAALRDVDDADEIRKEMEKTATSLKRPKSQE